MAISGDSNLIVLDLDFSSYEQNCTLGIHRASLLRALHKIGQEYSDYYYGKNKIFFSEMVEYAYGEGYVYNSVWDSGTEVHVVMTDVKRIDRADKKFFNKIHISEKDFKNKLTPLRNVSSMKPGGTYIVVNKDIDLSEQLHMRSVFPN